MRHWYIAAAIALAGALNSPPVRAEQVQVTISNLQYSPAEVDANVGDTIVWVNKDTVDHTATAKGGWDVSMKPGKSARAVLKKAGTFNYHCRFHPNMTGKITVQPK